MSESEQLSGSFSPLGPQPVVAATYTEGDKRPPQATERAAFALEYIATQMGQIRKSLVEITERLDALVPKNRPF
jgi:hypothetical protein